jgi:hypothetical protein
MLDVLRRATFRHDRSWLTYEPSTARTMQKIDEEHCLVEATAALSAGFELERRPRRREPRSAGASLAGTATAKAHVRHPAHLCYSKQLVTVRQFSSTI